MRFSKMQGIGNDFVVLDAAGLSPGTDLPGLAIILCDRHFGIGADGLLVVRRGSGDMAFSMRMFNPDGTEDMCGNGLRCVGLWAHRAGWIGSETTFSVATKEGSKKMRLAAVSKENQAATVQVEMGQPKFHPADIPFRANESQGVNVPFMIDGTIYPLTALNTGSTHAVIFGSAPDEETFQRVSPQIERHPLFPDRTSVLWATPQDDGSMSVRIWERGVGETWGCGTGACAVGVAAQVQGLAPADKSIPVVSRGGTLEIEWAGEGSPILMTGPAEFVFEGNIRDHIRLSVR
jgi:diaminopimelate epimerase